MKEIKKINKNLGATEEEIIKVENSMNIILPEVYKKILYESNGGIINNRVLIYSIDEIEERNDTMEVSEYAKGYIAIGDDGGGLVILMLQDKVSNRAILVDIGDMNLMAPYCIIEDVSQWILQGCDIE